MTFDPDQYWTLNAHLIAQTSDSDEHRFTEGIIRDLLLQLGPIGSVIDVGCGRGRLARVVRDVLPAALYSGMDLGPAQIAATREVRPDGDYFQSRLQDFRPKRKWDLVIASEVLLHIPPDDIQQAVKNLRRLGRRWIVTVDWTQPVLPPIAEENWLHDYRSLFGKIEKAMPAGLQTVFAFRP